MMVGPRLRVVVAMVVPVLLVAIGVIGADSLRFRYGLDLGPCMQQMIFAQDGGLDLVGIGGSRFRNAFDPHLMQELFAAEHGKTLEVYDLGRSRHGPDHDYPLLRDLLDRHKVDHLLVMVDRERESKFSPAAYSVLTTRDLWRGLAARPHAPIEHFAATLKQQLMRIRDVLLLVPRDSGWTRRVRERESTFRECSPGARSVKQANVDAALRQRERQGFAVVEFDMDGPDQEFAVYWYRKIVALARAHGTSVSFIYLPRIACCHWSDKTAASFERTVGAPLLRVPIGLHDQMVKGGYRDQTHLREAGRKIFLPWLADTLVDVLLSGGGDESAKGP